MFVSVYPKSCSAGVISADLDATESSGALRRGRWRRCRACLRAETAQRAGRGGENKMTGTQPFWRKPGVFFFKCGQVWFSLDIFFGMFSEVTESFGEKLEVV